MSNISIWRPVAAGDRRGQVRVAMTIADSSPVLTAYSIAQKKWVVANLALGYDLIAEEMITGMCELGDFQAYLSGLADGVNALARIP